MHLKTRRYIALTFIAIFLVAAPLILLYTLGFRYDWKKHKILRTGGLYLYVQNPPQTTVYVNENPVNETWLPKKETQVQNLLPNDYRIKIEKNGYFSWEKTLPVTSQKITFAERITLFLRPQPQLLIAGRVERVSVSPQKKHMIYATADGDVMEIWLLRSEDTKSTLLSRLPKTSLKIPKQKNWARWSPNEEYLLLLTSDEKSKKTIPLLFDMKHPSNTLSLPIPANISFQDIEWSLVYDSILYGFTEHDILRINLSGAPLAPLLSEARSEKESVIESLLVEQGMIFWTEKTPEKNFLWRKKIDGGEAERLVELPQGNYSLLNNPTSEFLLLEEKQKHSLLLLERNNHHLALQTNADAVVWNTKKDKLLSWNDLELWAHTPTADASELLSRYGKNIERALWIPEADYILFSFADELSIIELDGRDQRNFYTLLKDIPLYDFAIADASRVLVATDLNGVEGVYELKIQ